MHRARQWNQAHSSASRTRHRQRADWRTGLRPSMLARVPPRSRATLFKTESAPNRSRSMPRVKATGFSTGTGVRLCPGAVVDRVLGKTCFVSRPPPLARLGSSKLAIFKFEIVLLFWRHGQPSVALQISLPRTTVTTSRRSDNGHGGTMNMASQDLMAGERQSGQDVRSSNGAFTADASNSSDILK